MRKLWFASLCLAASLAGLLQADAAEMHNAATSTVVTYPSGLTVSFSSTSHATFGGTTSATAAFNGNPADYYDPRLPDLSAVSFNLTTAATSGNLGILPGTEFPKGTVTFTFSRPVTNPRFMFARMGGMNGTVVNTTAWTLADGQGVGTTADISAMPASSGVRVVTDPGSSAVYDNANHPEYDQGDAGNARIEVTSAVATTACGSPATTSGCGGVRLNGTYSSVTFNVAYQMRSVTGGTTAPNQGADAYGVVVVLDQDYSDTPASYGVAGHLLGNLFLGNAASVDPIGSPDTATAALPSASPRASNTASGDQDNAFSALSDVGVGTYTLTVPISGNAAGKTVCGWIDFNRDGSFGNDTGEEACATVAAAATSASLSWTIPSGAGYFAGASYARFRIGYDSAGASQPTGLATTGEVEDYTINLLPRVRLSKVLAPTTDAGLFNLSISPGAPAAVTAGTPTATNAGHNGTTGFAAVPLNTAITISETAGTGTDLANYTPVITCQDRAATALTLTGSGASRGFTSLASAPASPTTPGTGTAALSEISCSTTNTRLSQQFSLAKEWITGAAGNTASATATVGGVARATFASTANTNTTGTAVTVYAGETVTLPAETFGGGADATHYTAAVQCTGGSPLASGATGRTVTITTSTTATICTYRNTSRIADLAIFKTNTPAAGNSDQVDDTLTQGTTTSYTLRVVNNGPATVTGAVVRDTPSAGLTCPNGNAVSCSPAAACAAPYTIAALTGSTGIALGTLAEGQAATLQFTCNVN